ncbi:hypothetical protein HHL16_01220 [Pseudoflavitalea sp. G-6-1-2]|uniref:hypothetical protein n=1 Tax=Pseudoflavitalea sp. G-6-1-2 TaxID=2728841 RepID=UPI00146BAEAD|nr:hypothetical protein [Pseudoflavitalea sp. G-6-1-2]NML19468.1 hypothetical protein [Pseudoflavitalea sp. G-6-1-2]
MKQILSILTLLLFLSAAAFAQDSAKKKTDKMREPGQRVEALKIAFITRKLDLSTEEAQKFWPIYNKYSAELRKVRQDARLNKEAEIETEEKVLNIRKRYNIEFTKALPADKVNAFFKAEKEFGTMLQKELMERKQRKMEKFQEAN